VPQKPAHVGLWLSELCCLLDEDSPYLLDVSMWSVDTNRGQSQPVIDFVGRWKDIVEKLAPANRSCTLTFNAFDTDNPERDMLIDSNVPFLVALNSSRFKSLVEATAEHVKAPGDWAALYNERTNELFVNHYCRDTKLGRKYVLGNAVRRVNQAQEKHRVPGSDEYAQIFNVCDLFNRGLHDRTWPNKHGGFKRLGDRGSQDDFIFSAALKNAFLAYEINANIRKGVIDFQTHCLELSEELYAYSLTL